MSDQHGELIEQFCHLTAADPDEARQLLEASKWDLMTAVNHFYEEGGHDSDDMDYEDEEAEPVQRPTASSTQHTAQMASGSSKSKGPVTLGDLSKRGHPAVGGDDEEAERDQNYFAGGEKSGLAIKTPGERKGLEEMLKKAAQDHGRREEEAPRPSGSRFTGVGHTLGSEDTPSVTVPDPLARQPRESEVVRRDLTFWRNGLSVDDGPLLRYDDPANSAILNSIQHGRAPAELINVGIGQEADVHVHKRLDEDYAPPKPKRQAFSGSGMRLGSPTPGVPSPSSSIAQPTTSSLTTPSSSAAPQPPSSVSVDNSAPTTLIRIRLGDGASLVSRFNHTHTVGELYAFVNAASLESRSRNYVLQTTFPNKELKDHDVTLKDAGLVNANVVQKWV